MEIVMENKKFEIQKEMIKGYLKRLVDGDALEKVRKDFVKEFKDVEPMVILRAEQDLINEGTPVDEVRMLCDVHSALFHGMTTNEQNTGQIKVQADEMRQKRSELTASLIKLKGHPLNTFALENEALQKLIIDIRNSDSYNISSLIEKLKQLSVHYAKKGDLLYPLLKVTYEISGPSDVMWTTDDEIRDEITNILSDKNHDGEWNERLRQLLKRIEEMIYKEANILFPNCAFNFTQKEWYGIYQDSKDYPVCFGIEKDEWSEAEEFNKNENSKAVQDKYNDEIILAGGHMNAEQLSAMLNTIPLEITFVDSDNINRYFNEGHKVFKRPGMAIDREVFSCHPPKIEKQVRRIIEEFRNNTLDKIPIWMEKNGRTMLVTYMAVRDNAGKYLGTMELVQDMEFAKEYFNDKSNI